VRSSGAPARRLPASRRSHDWLHALLSRRQGMNGGTRDLLTIAAGGRSLSSDVSDRTLVALMKAAARVMPETRLSTSNPARRWGCRSKEHAHDSAFPEPYLVPARSRRVDTPMSSSACRICRRARAEALHIASVRLTYANTMQSADGDASDNDYFETPAARRAIPGSFCDWVYGSDRLFERNRFAASPVQRGDLGRLRR